MVNEILMNIFQSLILNVQIECCNIKKIGHEQRCFHVPVVKVRAQKKSHFVLYQYIKVHSIYWLYNIKRYFIVISDNPARAEPMVKGLPPCLLPTQRSRKSNCDITGRVPKS